MGKLDLDHLSADPGKMVPADIFDEVRNLVGEYRTSKGAGK